MPIDSDRIEAAVAELLAAIGDDPGREGLRETPRRVASAYRELFAGVGRDPAEALASRSDFPDSAERAGEVVVLRGIEFRSMCEHHLLPFFGEAHVAYLPGARFAGLGALADAVEIAAARPQLQERLTEDVADALLSGLGARGVLVVLEAAHGCVSARGPRQGSARTVTLAARGALEDPVRRAEAMRLIGGGLGPAVARAEATAPEAATAPADPEARIETPERT
ncbi:MAG: GTP cyclohydrolase I FolE [Micrococcales bacterium 73-13]|nr:MAG: GTP cyclohydrolase I FolE [Micrococcales bacterium 73-13]